jgi:Mg2+ and Co2+ transporter CorA
MRTFTINAGQVLEVAQLDLLTKEGLAPQSFVWISCTLAQFNAQQQAVQACLQRLCGTQLVDLHIADLRNQQLPSHYDYTSQYDLLVFRRLAPEHAPVESKDGSTILRRVNTNPVGFAVFDKVLLTVHPDECAVRTLYVSKLLSGVSTEYRAAGARVPTSPADLMLRIINQMVDGYLALRKMLTQQLDLWQAQLLDPKMRIGHWPQLLETRLALHQLDETCEEQRACIQDWNEAVKTWPEPQSSTEARERELLQIRSRDVLEHIERVVHHVERLEQSAETAVQMLFSAQSHRTNDIMRTLTALTAIFLPLNLIAAIFGMNFDFIPLLHQQTGFWWALGSMALIAVSLVLIFWRKRYLARTTR